MTRLRKILSLSPGDHAVLADAVILALPVELGLRCIGFDRLVKVMSRSVKPSRAAVDPDRAARLVDRVWRLYPFATCLKKSLVLWWILRRRGVHADLRIGVRRVEGRFESHAWVQHGGRVLLDADLAEGFTPLALKF